MKIKNSTDWPNHFLRRMTAWCCRQLKLPVGYITECRFAVSRSDYGGLCYGRRIGVRVGKLVVFPCHNIYGNDYRDRLEILVGVTAHELAHSMAFREKGRTRRGGYGGSERRTEFLAQQVLEAFRGNRDGLLVCWSSEPQKKTKPEPTRQELNDAKTRKQLATWERKLKLAKTKVAAYRRKVRYYDRVAATRPNQKNQSTGRHPKRLRGKPNAMS